jgi:hypothetical protein
MQIVFQWLFRFHVHVSDSKLSSNYSYFASEQKMKEFQSKIVTLNVDVLTSKEDHMLASY